MHQSKISSRGRTTIPKAIRDEIGLKPGDTVRYSIRNGAIHIRPLISAKSLKGMLKYDGPPLTQEEIEKRFEQALREKFDPKGKRFR